MGGKPSKGTSKDMRLKENNPGASKKPAVPNPPAPPKKGGAK